MIFRRCCPRCHPKPCMPVWPMTGQGDGQTAQIQPQQGPMQVPQMPTERQQNMQNQKRCACHERVPGLQAARAQLIESIAREEKSIADLLMAQAHRLMRMAQSGNCQEMSMASQSIHQTLEAIIDLEHVLLEKLELTMGECMMDA